jgi:hypothetical protein
LQQFIQWIAWRLDFQRLWNSPSRRNREYNSLEMQRKIFFSSKCREKFKFNWQPLVLVLLNPRKFPHLSFSFHDISVCSYFRFCQDWKLKYMKIQAQICHHWRLSITSESMVMAKPCFKQKKKPWPWSRLKMIFSVYRIPPLDIKVNSPLFPDYNILKYVENRNAWCLYVIIINIHIKYIFIKRCIVIYASNFNVIINNLLKTVL